MKWNSGHCVPEADRPGDDGQGAGSHGHGVCATADRRWLTAALTVIVGFMAGEVVVGKAAHSLALLSDAAHMLTDAAALILALVAMRWSTHRAGSRYAHEIKRAEALAALTNGLTLLLLAFWLTVEAVGHLVNPPRVTGGLVVLTALVDIPVGLTAAWCLSKANRSSLNVQGAYLHILSDLVGALANAMAGAVVLATGFLRADALASLIVVAVMLRSGTGLVRAAGRHLSAGLADTRAGAFGTALPRRPGVTEVHDPQH
ncbi:cation diffusion facilitator family transporter [Streptomyces sp. NPDC002536]